MIKQNMKPNVIFILLDGARWDRLNESKEFQDVCKKGTILNNVSTAMPYTIGSINVTFSGLFGKENGIDAYHKMLRLKKSIKNLPEIFQSQGYFTACDILTKNIIPNRGFNIHQTHNAKSTAFPKGDVSKKSWGVFSGTTTAGGSFGGSSL